MAHRNVHRLSRHIPDPIAREVRQRCGFGCVIDGAAIYDYEHFDPEFKDARAHDAEGITLLCMQCNQKKRRGLLSEATVRAANANPRCKQVGFASETFDIGPQQLIVEIASNRFENCDQLIRVRTTPILSVRPPETAMQPYRLSGLFADETGATTLTIKDNVWTVGADNWDIECEGPLITVRRGPGDIALILRAAPPDRVVVEQLNMQCNGIYLRGDRNRLEFSYNGTIWSGIEQVGLRYCAVAIDLV